MSQVFQFATRISTPWALAAFAIAAIVFLLLKRQGRVQPIAWAAIAAIMLLGIAPTIIQVSGFAIYRVRVTVVGPEGTPVDETRVWSSIGGEPKKVTGGWEFDIPAGSRPTDGKLTVWASQEAAYLKGNQEVKLNGDHNPAITIRLESDRTATVHGLVLNRKGVGIAGARVSVAGYESEAVVTKEGGSFLLPAHAARDQNVLLHVEAKGFAGANQWQMAGDHPATIVLGKS